MKRGSKILIVEDEELYRIFIRKKLVENGYFVIEAKNGAEGLEVLRTSQVDMAIVDLEMPVMNGMEFINWIKEVNPNFPIIIITAHATDFSPQEIIQTNVNAFLQKPINVDELLRTIEKL